MWTTKQYNKLNRLGLLKVGDVNGTYNNLQQYYDRAFTQTIIAIRSADTIAYEYKRLEQCDKNESTPGYIEQFDHRLNMLEACKDIKKQLTTALKEYRTKLQDLPPPPNPQTLPDYTETMKILNEAININKTLNAACKKFQLSDRAST
jgi:hypothetical protein